MAALREELVRRGHLPDLGPQSADFVVAVSSGRDFSAACAPDRTASFHCSKVSPVTPGPRESLSRSSPLRQRRTASTFRWEENLPRSRAAPASPSVAVQAPSGPAELFFLEMKHFVSGTHSVPKECPRKSWGGGHPGYGPPDRERLPVPDVHGPWNHKGFLKMRYFL